MKMDDRDGDEAYSGTAGATMAQTARLLDGRLANGDLTSKAISRDSSKADNRAGAGGIVPVAGLW